MAEIASKKKDKNHNVQQNFQYSFDDNGCETGQQTFSEKEKYCQALLNEALNKGCAQVSRFNLYKAECGELPNPDPRNHF